MLFGFGGVLVRPVASKIASKWAARRTAAAIPKVHTRSQIHNIYDALPDGDSKGVKLLADEAELLHLHRQLTQGGTPGTMNNYDGQVTVLPDGSRIGLRTSRKNGSTIDIVLGDNTKRKVHHGR